MKLVFEAGSLHSMYEQLKEAMDTIQYGMVERPKDVKVEIDTHSGARLEKISAPTVYGNPGVTLPPLKTTGVEATPQVTMSATELLIADEANKLRNSPIPFAPPDFQQPVSTPTRIDGYVISDGKVWVPVEGRSSAYTGVEVDEYHRRKNAAVELDTEGKAWDASIHASTKTKTVKGVWKKKKQFGDKEETVEQAQPAQAVAAPQEMPQFEQSSAPIGRAPEMHNYESFKKNLQMILVRLHTAGKIDRPYMAELTKWADVTNLWEVTKNEEKTKQLFDLFVQNQYIIGV